MLLSLGDMILGEIRIIERSVSPCEGPCKYVSVLNSGRMTVLHGDIGPSARVIVVVTGVTIIHR